MTQEEKQLLLKDICSRLPYGIIVHRKSDNIDLSFMYSDPIENMDFFVHCFDTQSELDDMELYLRPMSSMTEEEARFILGKIVGDREILSVDIGRDEITANVDDGVSSYEKVLVFYDEIVRSIDLLDYLNTRHFDYRGLIGKGLAIEAPEGMYVFIG